MTVIVDTFNRADNASSLGTTSDGTATWTALAGTWGTASNQAYCSAAAGTSRSVAVVSTPAADGTVQATLSVAAVSGIAFRVHDASNFLQAYVSGGNLSVYKWVSGSATLVVNCGTAASGDVIAVVLAGSSITVKKNGATVGSATESTYQTETKHGLVLSTSTLTARWDDFSFTYTPPTSAAAALTASRAARTISLTGGVGRAVALTATRVARTFVTVATPARNTALAASRTARTFGVTAYTDISAVSGRPDAASAAGWPRSARGLSVTLSIEPPVAPPPTGTHLALYRRSSFAVSSPTFAADGWSHAKQAKSVIDTSLWGRHAFVFDFVDRSFFRGVPVRLLERSHTNPFGHELAVLFVGGATPFERPGVGALAWLSEGKHLRIRHIWPDGSIDHTWAWLGQISNVTPVFDKGWGFRVEVKGFLVFQADDYQRKPLPTPRSTGRIDIGTRIADVMNVLGRHYPAIQPVTTGIGTRKRGSLSQKALSFVRELLADAWTSDGRQWTVMPDRWATSASITLPDPSTVDYTISLGQEGCDFSSLHSEGDEMPNVVYGEWVGPSGGRHQRLMFPRYHEDTAPPFPLAVGAVFNPGSSTTGFRDFSDWMGRNGFSEFDSQDTYLASDEDDVRTIQRRMGITIDGIVGAQTWGTAFNTGGSVGDLRTAVYLPIAYDPRVEPWLYGPDGKQLTLNPEYDPMIRRVETYINFGEGLTYRDVRRAAQQIVDRSTSGVNLVGQIVCSTDPEEGSWLTAVAGTTLRVRYLYGAGAAGITFHLARIRLELDESKAAVKATLDVDTKWRDAYTVTQIIQRNKESRDDPARQIRRRQSTGLSQDTKIQFDADIVGRIYRHQIQGGFWRVVEFPAASWGTFVRVTATTSPMTEFVLMLFSKEITPRDLDRLVGDPLSVKRPYNPQAQALADAGFIQAWGSGAQPAGYSQPGAADGYKDPGNGDPPDPLTGRLEYDSSVDFAADNGASLFLAEWAPVSTTIRAQLYLAPVEF